MLSTLHQFPRLSGNESCSSGTRRYVTWNIGLLERTNLHMGADINTIVQMGRTVVVASAVADGAIDGIGTVSQMLRFLTFSQTLLGTTTRRAH